MKTRFSQKPEAYGSKKAKGKGKNSLIHSALSLDTARREKKKLLGRKRLLGKNEPQVGEVRLL